MHGPAFVVLKNAGCVVSAAGRPSTSNSAAAAAAAATAASRAVLMAAEPEELYSTRSRASSRLPMSRAKYISL